MVTALLLKLLILVLIGICVILLFKLVKNVIKLILNGVLGLLALFSFNYIFGTSVAINFWSVVITAIGGIIGFAVVIVLHFLGFAF